MSRLTVPVRVFVNASAIGFYGVGGDEIIDEQGLPTCSFQSRLCQEWETAARAAARLGARLVRLRIGLVLGIDGGALPQLLRPMRLGLGAVFGNGTQWVSWIHIDDLVRIFELAIDTPRVTGAVNAVSPEPVTHRQFQEALARQLGRPLWLRVPARILRLSVGEISQLLVDGQRIAPTKLKALGFTFRHRQVHGALRALLGTKPSDDVAEEVYFNGDCPVCRAEMTHYASLCAHRQLKFRFIDSMKRPNEFVQYGLRREHLERRVYLRAGDGRILSGLPALIHLWSKLPGYRWLSSLLALPVLHPISALVYDHLVAPSLAFWANRRVVSQPGPRHGWF